MKPKTKKYLLWIIGITIVFPIVYSQIYYMKTFEITVVDEETNEPLEGVVLLAYWQLESGSFGGAVAEDIAAVREAVSDKSGKVGYRGFIKVLPFYPGWIRNAKNPTFSLYKSGYEDGLYNNVGRKIGGGRIYNILTYNERKGNNNPITGNFAFWNSMSVKLKKHEESIENFQFYRQFGKSVTKVLNKSNFKCDWEEIPFSLVAKMRSKSNNIDEDDGSIEGKIKKSLKNNVKCMGFNKFKEQYL